MRPRRLKKKLSPVNPKDRIESDPPRAETQWLNQQRQQGRPPRPYAIPSQIEDVSEFPELTLARHWIISNCRFAERASSCASCPTKKPST